MQKKKLLLLLVPILFGTAFVAHPEWGFFGHRKINRMSVFTLPPELLQFFKTNIEFVTEHSVDPDKRRYATKHEGVRHYIDIDHWGTYPFYEVPRRFDDALIKYASWKLIQNQDTIDIRIEKREDQLFTFYEEKAIDTLIYDDFRDHFNNWIMPQYYEDEWAIEDEKVSIFFPSITEGRLVIKDEFSSYGILPYHLNKMYYQLISAFEKKDKQRILRLATEFGHYIGDAHVPLHTTENYNGQLTGQLGIHAFWESRLPELFADEQYSFLVGKAAYISEPLPYFWNIVLESHSLLDEVLSTEMNLRSSFPEDQQMCFDERLNRTIRTQCPEFSAAYHEKLDGMVEKRMQDCILSIGSVWYSAWHLAGEPNLMDDTKEAIKIEEEPIIADKDVKTREHSN